MVKFGSGRKNNVGQRRVGSDFGKNFGYDEHGKCEMVEYSTVIRVLA